MRLHLSALACLLVISGCSRLGGSSAPTLRDGTVTVDVEQPTVEVKYLDGIYWPQGKACGRAYTYWTFMCRTDFHLKPLPDLSKPGNFVYEITAVSMKLGLPLRTWLPFGVKDKLRAHEAGHTKMCQEIYKKADVIARECASEMMGRHVVSTAYDPKLAEEGAMTEAKRTLDALYREKIQSIADDCGVIYDSVTNHGMNEVPEERAMKESFAAYEKSHPKTPIK